MGINQQITPLLSLNVAICNSLNVKITKQTIIFSFYPFTKKSETSDKPKKQQL